MQCICILYIYSGKRSLLSKDPDAPPHPVIQFPDRITRNVSVSTRVPVQFPPDGPGGGKTYPLLRPVRVRPPSVQVSLIVQMNKLGMRYIAGEAQITPKWLPFGYHQLGYKHIIHERKVLWGRVWFDILEWLLRKMYNNLILWLPW